MTDFLTNVVSFALLMIGGALCCRGSNMLELPISYQKNLQLLKVAVSFNTEWSPVFSEKLKKGTNIKDQPDPNFCKVLTDPITGFIDTFDVIREILENCAWSGMYVEYGVHLLGCSLQCFYYRFAHFHLTTIDDNFGKYTKSFNQFIDNLINDHRLLIDKLAVVNTDLTVPIQLIAYIYDMKRLSQLTDIPDHVLKSKDKASKRIRKHVTKELSKCIHDQTTIWYNHTGTMVSVLKTTKLQSTINTQNENTSTLPNDPVVMKVEELREVMVRVFGNLLIKEISRKSWKQVLDGYVFLKETDMQATDGNSKIKPKDIIDEEEDFEDDFGNEEID